MTALVEAIFNMYSDMSSTMGDEALAKLEQKVKQEKV
jgi:hypothetical protein